MHGLTEEHKKAIPVVLDCGTHESYDDALDAAASGLFEKKIGSDAGDPMEFAEELTGRFLELRPVAAKFTWALNRPTHAQLKTEAHDWVKSQYEFECAGMGISSRPIAWFEPATDLEIARIALDEPGYRDKIATQIRQQIQQEKKGKAWGHSG